MHTHAKSYDNVQEDDHHQTLLTNLNYNQTLTIALITSEKTNFVFLQNDQSLKMLSFPKKKNTSFCYGIQRLSGNLVNGTLYFVLFIMLSFSW